MADGATTDSTTTSLEVFNADGSQTVIVSRFNYGSKSMKAMIGLDKTDIGIESVSPPFGTGFVALAAQASNGGAAARVASEQIKASCKGGLVGVRHSTCGLPSALRRQYLGRSMVRMLVL